MAMNQEQAGVIQADCVYTLDEIRRRLRLGNWALRQAQRNGLPVRRVGRRGFVLGRDLIQYIASANSPEGRRDAD